MSVSKSLDEIVADALMTGYGYRKTTELRGEYIVGSNHKVESNTLHTVEVWVRDRSGQPPNPANRDEVLS